MSNYLPAIDMGKDLKKTIVWDPQSKIGSIRSVPTLLPCSSFCFYLPVPTFYLYKKAWEFKKALPQVPSGAVSEGVPGLNKTTLVPTKKSSQNLNINFIWPISFHVNITKPGFMWIFFHHQISEQTQSITWWCNLKKNENSRRIFFNWRPAGVHGL